MGEGVQVVELVLGRVGDGEGEVEEVEYEPLGRLAPEVAFEAPGAAMRRLDYLRAGAAERVDHPLADPLVNPNVPAVAQSRDEAHGLLER